MQFFANRSEFWFKRSRNNEIDGNIISPFYAVLKRMWHQAQYIKKIQTKSKNFTYSYEILNEMQIL